MKISVYFALLVMVSTRILGMSAHLLWQPNQWNVNQSGALSSLTLQPIADNEYTIQIFPEHRLWHVANAPQLSYIDSRIALVNAQHVQPTLGLQASPIVMPAINQVSLAHVPVASSYMQSVVATHFAYNPHSFHLAQMRFLSKCLRCVARYPGGLDVYRARAAVIQCELSQAITVMRQATSSIVNKPHAECARVFESWIKLNNITLSVPELNSMFQEAVAQIQQITVDPNSLSYNPVLAECSLRQAQKVIDTFEDKMQSWINSNQFLQQCADDAGMFLAKRYPQGSSSSTMYCEAQSNVYQAQQVSEWNFLKESYQPKTPEFTCKVQNERAFQDLSCVVQLCEEGKFGQAHQIVNKYFHGDSLVAVPFLSTYFNRFANVFTAEGIEKRLVSNDPLYHRIKTEFVAPARGLPQVHPQNGELSLRKQKYDSFKEFLSVTQTNSAIDKIIYQMIDRDISQWQACGDYLNSLQLVSDSADPFIREACVQMYENGLPKGICKPQENKICSMPTKIDTATYLEERTLLWDLVKCSAQCPCPAIQLQVERATHYLQKGLQDNNRDYINLAHAMGHALKDQSADQRILNLSDYSVTLANPEQTTLQEAAVQYIARNIEGGAWESIERVDQAYKAMRADDIQGAFYLEKAFAGQGNPDVLSYPYDAPMAQFSGINENVIIAHAQTDKATTQVLLDNGAEITLRRYEMLPSIKKFLSENGIDPEKYGELRGNLAQHIQHAQIISQVVKQHDLSGLKLIHASNLDQLLHLSTHVTDLSREYNAVGDVMQSSALSQFGWQLVGYIENAAQFGIDTSCSVGEGVVLGLNNFAHAVTHPQETIRGMACNFRDLLIGTLKVMHTNAVIEEKFSIFKSPAENEQMIRHHLQEFEPIFKAIEEKLAQTTFQDVVREGTATLVEGVLTARTAATIGKIANVAKAHGGQLTQRIIQSLEKAEVAVVMAEGLEVRAAVQASETAVARSSKDFKALNDCTKIMHPNSLTEAIGRFEHVEGAMGANGPLRQVLKRTGIGSELKESIKGPVFELETALKLENSGEKILKFGEKVPLFTSDGKTIIRKLEIDIVTSGKFIECKNWNWEKLTIDNIRDLQSKLIELQRVALQNGKHFELHSKNPLPNILIEWLQKNNIKFCEG